MLTMSQFIPSLKPFNNEIYDQQSKVHEVVFFLALYSMALGIGGLRSCVQTFGADQFDDDYLEERQKKTSFFNWCTFTQSSAFLLGTTVVVCVQDFVGWGVACLALTIFNGSHCHCFLYGDAFLQVQNEAKRKPFHSNYTSPNCSHKEKESVLSFKSRFIV